MIQAAHRQLVGLLFIAVWLCALEESGGLIGKVVDITEGPLHSARVRLYSSDLDRQYEDYADSGGQFHLKDLPPGAYRVTISLQGFLDKTIPKVHVTPGQPADLGVLRLDLAPCNTPGGPICDEVEPIKTRDSIHTQSNRDIPVLTVCEALRDLKLYNGKDVVIVGRSGWTFEGTFLSEDCEPDGRTTVQGNRWLALIHISDEDQRSGRYTGFHFDEELLRRKLVELKRTTRLTSEQKSVRKSDPFVDRWVAILGRLVSPVTLRPHRPPHSSQSKNITGNGFGANGSVPAKVIPLATYELSTQK